jgi:site-specific DNA-methyltransferase (adenine-specific)
MIELFEGDCLDAMKQIPDASVDALICDLPYGVTARNPWDAIIPFVDLWCAYERIVKESGAMVFTATQPFASALVMSRPGLFKYEWIWRKQQGTGFLNAKKQPLRNHEQVLVFYRKQPTYHPQMTEGKPYKCLSGEGSTDYGEQVRVVTENKGERYPLTVQEFKYDKNKLHPTQKPVALMEYLIRTYTNEGETVLDSCMGSGTTGVACIKTNRKFIGIEKDVKYFQVAKERMQELDPFIF